LAVAAAGVLFLGGCGSSGGGSGTSTFRAVPRFQVGTLPRAASTTPPGYSPAQIRHAYGVDKLTQTGSGATVAIVTAYGSPTLAKDLATFSSQYKLATANLTIVNASGAPSGSDAGWALETSLDAEWAHALAPSANLLVVVAKDDTLSSLLAAVDYATAHAKIVSMSWGSNEFNGETSYDSHFNKPGVTCVAAGGDSGGGPGWPAVAPTVTAIGGTTLTLDASGDVISETAWSGSNGGRSQYEAIPAYQTAVLSGKARGVPDVSFDGDPNTGLSIYDSTPYERVSGWFEVGGTSAGTPSWAGIYALVDDAASLGVARTTNAAVYAAGEADFRDITKGSDAQNKAGVGYDLVTGLGSPLANVLVPALIAKP
jgi:subtilase family serine protease